MKILSIDTSSNLCSIAILEDFTVLYEETIDNGLTHSQKLMPMVETALNSIHLSLADIDLYACSIGPGSFTGIRIGISTIKAFVDVYSKPAIGVSSLETLANSVEEMTATVISLLDAKNGNIYGGIFEKNLATILPLQDLFACTIEEAIAKIHSANLENIVFIGDGCVSHQELLEKHFPNAMFANHHQQNAIFVGKVAMQAYIDHKQTPVTPLYLKKSQAERMLEEKKNECKN